MNVDDMRAKIKQVYPHDTWSRRVDAMWDGQVIAIYYDFKEKGKFDKPKGKPGRPRKNPAVQLSFEDLCKGSMSTFMTEEDYKA